MDVTSTIQFSGVTNNAQLELVRAVKLRTDSPVTVFLQLESGKRLSGTFLPSCKNDSNSFQYYLIFVSLLLVVFEILFHFCFFTLSYVEYVKCRI